MCPFEAECAGLRYAVKKEGHFIVACPQITVITDCKSMGSTYAKPLEEISNRRIQKMFLDVSHVNLVFKHIPGVLNSTTETTAANILGIVGRQLVKKTAR